jgi:hypothetical protein
MKIIAFVFIIVSFCVKAQDTIVLFQTAQGYSKKQIFTKKDTLEVCFYPNGKVESRQLAFPDKRSFEQTRYYPNGKVMWKRTIKEEKANGPSTYFNEKGKRIVTVNFLNDTPVDTIVHTKSSLAITGNYKYWSRVYGGAQNEDGTSNVSEHSGPGVFMEFKLIQHLPDSTKKMSTKYAFRTDAYGNFLIVLPKRKDQFGIFPSSFPDDQIKSGMSFPPDSMESSGSSAWHLTKEINTDEKSVFIYTELRSSSIGYAP